MGPQHIEVWPYTGISFTLEANSPRGAPHVQKDSKSTLHGSSLFVAYFQVACACVLGLQAWACDHGHMGWWQLGAEQLATTGTGHFGHEMVHAGQSSCKACST